MTETITPTILTWRHFHVSVARLERLSPSFLRVTFTGPDLDEYADLGYDARTKLILPLAEGYAHLPEGADWYPQWRRLPPEQQNPIRTYTTRAVRPGVREVDVDIVLHPDGGPAARWAEQAAPGDRLVLLGPNVRADGPHGGVEFRWPGPGRPLLLVGDETAVPAIATILSQLPAYATGAVLLEVPEPEDRWELRTPAGMSVTWLARRQRPHGELLVPAVQSAARVLAGAGRPGGADLEEVDIDTELLWEVAEPASDSAELYAWLAGEAGVITTLRRYLVRDLGIDRGSVSFMGYWRRGRAES